MVGQTKNAERSQYIVLLLISVFLLFFDRLGVFRPLHTLVEYMVLPLKERVHISSLSAQQFFDIVQEYQTLKLAGSDIEKYKREVEEQKIQLSALSEENTSLRKQLEAPLPSEWKFLPATVLGISRYMHIKAGENEGVKVGMSVVVEKTLIGKIVSTAKESSRVLLLTDPDSNVDAISSRGTRGKIIGQYGEKVFFTNVLQKDQLFLDDPVFSSGDDGYGTGLFIGTVKHIETKDVQVYKKAELDLPLEDSKLFTVFVLFDN